MRPSMKLAPPASPKRFVPTLISACWALHLLGTSTNVVSADEPDVPGNPSRAGQTLVEVGARTGKTSARTQHETSREALADRENNKLVIYSTEAGKPPNMFSGIYENKTSGTIEFHNEPNALAWIGSKNYVGFWHSPTLDLSGFERIEIKIKSRTATNNCVDFRIEDQVPGQETGRIYRSGCLQLTGDFQKYTLTADDFSKFPHYGEQEGELDWTRIKNIQIQVGSKSEEHHPYYGTYHDEGQGSITVLKTDSAFAWHGHRCYVGFSFTKPIDLTQLKEVQAYVKGVGKVDIHLIDSSKVSYFANDLNLEADTLTHRLAKSDFTLFPYSTVGVIDWTSIQNVQLQVPNPTGARVALERLIIELHDGTQHRIDANTDYQTYVALKEINIIMDDKPIKLSNKQHPAPRYISTRIANPISLH